VCAERTGTNMRLRIGGCGGTIWGTALGSWGPTVGVDSAGNIKIANDLQIGGSANVVFTNLGGASTTGAFSLTDPKTSRSRSVAVDSTGRVTLQ
jgi:hypothetical protein